MKTNIKVIATSLSLATSVGAVAGMGGLSVQSHLGQPFSGSIIVSGDEARALIASGSVNVSGGIRGSVIKQGEDRVLVRLRSSSPVREPVITFTVSAGRQTREYTAFIDPARYTPKEAPTREESHRGRGEQNMRQNPQRTQQDFIERKKPVAEQRRAANSVSQKTQGSEMAAVKKAAKVNVSPRRHRAHAGEKLANIVERYRPRNMSQQTAMRALMLANPSAFKHGTTIRRNVTLYIPTESQWHAYAQRAQKQTMKERVKQVRQSSQVAPQNNVVMPVESEVLPENNPPVAEPPKPAAVAKPSVPANPPVASEVKPAAPEVKASEPASTNVKTAESASAAVQNASAVTNEKGAVPKAADASNVTPATASAAAGSAVVAAASKPRPAVKRPPVVEPEPVEEETDYLPLIAGGLGGLVLVGGLGYLAMRRRKNAPAAVADDEEWTSDEETTIKSSKNKKDAWDEDFSSSLSGVGVAAGATTAGVAAATVIDDEPYFDDFDANNKVATSSSQNNAAKDEFNLDNFDSFETFDDSDDSFVNNANQAKNNQLNEEFTWLASEESAAPATQLNNDFVVAEEEDWSLDKLDAISSSTLTPQSAEQSFSLDDFVVDDVKPAVTAATVGAGVAATAAAQSFDDAFDFSDFENHANNNKQESTLDDFIVADDVVAEVQATPVIEAENGFNDFAAFDADFVAVSEPAAIQTAPVVAEGAAFNLDTLDAFVVADNAVQAAPVAETSFDDFAAFNADLPKVESPASIQAVSVADEDLSFGLAAFDDFVLPENEVAEQSAPIVDNVLADDFAVLNQADVGTQQMADAIIQEMPTMTEDDLLSIDEFVVTDAAPAIASPVAEGNNQANALFDDAFVAFEEAAPKAENPMPTFGGLEDLGGFETVSQIDTVSEVPSAKDDDLAFGLDAFEDFVVEDAPQPVAASSEDEFALFESAVVENVSAVENNLALDTTAFDDFTAPVAVLENETVAAATSPVQLDDISIGNFNLADEIDAAVTPIIPSIEETPVSFDAPIIEEPTISLDAPAVSNGFDDLSFDVADLAVEMPQPSASVGMVDLATGPLASEPSSLDNVNLDSLEVIEDVQGWQQDGNANAGFVSGAVSDMTEPLEAKFELAKMYLEIDDAVAARETLRELVSESSGTIQEQASQLLAELGG